MNRRFAPPFARLTLLAAFGLLPPHTVEAQPTPRDLETGWLSDVGAGFKESRRTGKPLLVMFRCVP